MGQVKICPTCGTGNAPSEAFCSNCGGMIASVVLSDETAKLDPTAVNGERQEQALLANQVICPDPTCGHSNPVGQERCSVCNGRLIDPIVETSAGEPSARENGFSKLISKENEIGQQEFIPYKTGAKELQSLHDVAIYFAGDWDAGMSQIDDNYILNWADSNFPRFIDVDAMEFLKNIFRNRKQDHDIRLMQFIGYFAPELPPIWKGTVLTPDNLTALFEQAVNGDAAMRANAVEIIDRNIIKAASEINSNTDLTWCVNAMSEAVDSYNRSWQLIADSGGTIESMPSSSQAAPVIMLAAISEKSRERLRSIVLKEYRKANWYCSWYSALGNPGAANAGTLVVMHSAGPQALKATSLLGMFRSKRFLKFSIITVIIIILALVWYISAGGGEKEKKGSQEKVEAANSLSTFTALDSDTLCLPEEKVIFSCKTKVKIASVCASNDLSKTAGFMQYRFGKKGAPELVIPQKRVHPGKNAEIGNTLYANGGTDAFIRFKSGAYGYVVYTNELRDGQKWVAREGISVEKNGKEISNLTCKGDVISEIGSDFLVNAGIPKGERWP